MILRSAAALSLALIVAPPAAAQRGEAGIAVVPSGSEQALRLGSTVLSRPFGAQLVDRIAVVGSYRGAGGVYHLVRGDAGGECPARYVVVTRDGEGAPVVTEPFGTCGTGARGAINAGTFVVTMPATAAGGPAVRYGFDGGKMVALDARPAAAIADAQGRPGYAARQASACRSPTSADPATQAAVVQQFEAEYPAQYRRQASLRRAQITPEELRATVTGLACLSRWPGAQKVVPEAATPLFASKRYGPAAFAVIETVATDPASDANLRASVRAFGAEMLYRVDRREPL